MMSSIYETGVQATAGQQAGSTLAEPGPSTGNAALLAWPADSPHLRRRARRLSLELGLPVLENSLGEGRAVVLVTHQGLALGASAECRWHGLQAAYLPDLTALQVGSPARGGIDQPLVKALASQKRRRERLTVCDAMAGFGEDAWLMAGLGHRVVCIERSPAVFAVLRDAWSRAELLQPGIALRVRPILAEAAEVLVSINQRRSALGTACLHGPEPLLPRPDVVYLDPMFPLPRKKRRAERKAMQVLRRHVLAEAGEGQEEAILSLALRTANDRVVVKRPLRAAPLASGDIQPTHRVPGKSVRYDIYLSKHS